MPLCQEQGFLVFMPIHKVLLVEEAKIDTEASPEAYQLTKPQKALIPWTLRLAGRLLGRDLWIFADAGTLLRALLKSVPWLSPLIESTRAAIGGLTCWN